MMQLYQSKCSYRHKMNTALAVEKYMEYCGTPISFGRQKKPKSIIKNTLTEAEVTRLVFNCRNIKEKAVVSLLAYSGVRNKELCSLQVFHPTVLDFSYHIYRHTTKHPTISSLRHTKATNSPPVLLGNSSRTSVNVLT